MDNTRLNRRDFLKVIGTAGASFMIGIYLGGCDHNDEPEIQEGPSDSQATAYAALPSDSYFIPNIYLIIDNTSKLTVTAFRSEMGQGIHTSLATIIGEELDYNPENMTIEHAGAHAAYKKGISVTQLTGGSTSIATSWTPLREAGAAGRAMLLAAAAARWSPCRAALPS